MATKVFTVSDVAKHTDEKDGMYIIVDTGVYDITSTFTSHAWNPSACYYTVAV
jgi:cytochrome b involved in lipid metabolism